MEEIKIENASELKIKESIFEEFAKMLVDKFKKEQINEKEC